MKLHASAPTGAQVVTAYGEDYVTVSGVRYEQSIVVQPDRVQPWAARSFESLTEADFAALLQAGAEILILGTGAKQRFPHPRLTAPLARAGIGVVFMPWRPPCRTYNILVAEERKVAAALLFR